jgi:hypothetical protein
VMFEIRAASYLRSYAAKVLSKLRRESDEKGYFLDSVSDCVHMTVDIITLYHEVELRYDRLRVGVGQLSNNQCRTVVST